jgi:septal ring factor EnvC (AmiA/AmiB activator)
MADEPNNLVLEHLGGIGSDIHDMREEQREQRMRLNSIERNIAVIHAEIANFHGQVAEVGVRLDRVNDRLERIERRLDLVEV